MIEDRDTDAAIQAHLRRADDEPTSADYRAALLWMLVVAILAAPLAYGIAALTLSAACGCRVGL